MRGMPSAGLYATDAVASAAVRASFKLDIPVLIPGGTTSEADVAEVTSKDVTGIPPMVADMALLNPVPVKVTVSPDLMASGRRPVKESTVELWAAQPASIEPAEQTPLLVVTLTWEFKLQADSPSPATKIKPGLAKCCMGTLQMLPIQRPAKLVSVLRRITQGRGVKVFKKLDFPDVTIIISSGSSMLSFLRYGDPPEIQSTTFEIPDNR